MPKKASANAAAGASSPLSSTKGAVRVFGDAGPFAEEMRKVINDQEMSDIKFIIGEKREPVFAHRIILAARCEVFRAMFAEQKLKQSRRTAAGKGGDAADEYPPLVLPDVRAPVFRAVLEFIYSNCCELNANTVVEVLASAIEYGLPGLVTCCVDFITHGLKIENACEAIQAAITYGQDALREVCMEFIEQHTQAVFSSRSFVEMSAETFGEILKSDNLNIAEVDVLEAVKQWGTVNSVVVSKPLGEVIEGVIRHVRFPLLPTDVLSKLEKENQKTNPPTIPVQLISNAWRFHATQESDPNNPQFRPRAMA